MVERVQNQTAVRVDLPTEGNYGAVALRSLISTARREFGPALENFELRLRQGPAGKRFLELRKQSNFGAFKEFLGFQSGRRNQERREALDVLKRSLGPEFFSGLVDDKLVSASRDGALKAPTRNQAYDIAQRSIRGAETLFETRLLRGQVEFQGKMDDGFANNDHESAQNAAFEVAHRFGEDGITDADDARAFFRDCLARIAKHDPAFVDYHRTEWSMRRDEQRGAANVDFSDAAAMTQFEQSVADAVETRPVDPSQANAIRMILDIAEKISDPA